MIINIKHLFRGLVLTALMGAAAIKNSNAQALADITGSFNRSYGQVLQEKVFVHTDKTFYLTGEILWFKIYVVDASFNKPLSISKVAYVELLNGTNASVLQAKIELKNGIGTGSLYLPITAENGNYKLRAYTNWMKNSSPELYFEQQISVVNPLVTPSAKNKEVITDYDARFFPEGGNLIEGIKSTVAFKVVAPNGKGSDVSGVIVNQRNDTVARIKSLKFGMGHFSFTPLPNNSYKAVMRTDDHNVLIKDLPATSKEGYVMQVDDSGPGQLVLNISSNVTGRSGETVYVFGHTGQYIKLAEAAVLNSGTGRLVIDKGRLGEGITRITLFNSLKQPVCERLYFKRPKQLAVGAVSDQLSYQPRQKINVEIDARSDAGKPRMADMSLAVYRLDSLETADPAQIGGYLWLSSEIKGNIEQPGYYLQNNTAESNEATDNLMLTQGWSRFNWSDATDAKLAAFKYLPELNGHLISASVSSTNVKQTVGNLVGFIGATGKKVQLYAAESDQAGRMLFNTKTIYGPNELVLQLSTERDSIFHLDILSPFSEQYSAGKLPALALTPNLKAALESHSIGMQALNIYAGDKIKQYYNPQADSSAFFGKPKTYRLDDFTRFTTTEEVLREYISEVNVVKQQKRFHIKVLNENGFLNGDPLVMLDGIPIINIDKVFTIDPLKVRKLDVINKRYYWGPSSSEGILSFTTYKGDHGGLDMDPHAVVVDYEGLQLQREFYAPIYDTDDKIKSRTPDFRNLLYWSPDVLTDAAGRARATFYAADQTGKYMGVLQGITTNGEAGSHIFTFEVK